MSHEQDKSRFQTIRFDYLTPAVKETLLALLQRVENDETVIDTLYLSGNGEVRANLSVLEDKTYLSRAATNAHRLHAQRERQTRQAKEPYAYELLVMLASLYFFQMKDDGAWEIKHIAPADQENPFAVSSWQDKDRVRLTSILLNQFISLVHNA
ncbi:hypothetical protein C5B42_05630 [Candidatus Cerribacteria bacterium 'Amazon FNV 2010 28 9']|uniref:Uncharacterized protein n=1 Tax=Candidatus Cerribacteria bacterium 'Amazon FNV 2010 28 9' TaxID=2081795 RepID=A0A317JLV2_9BACT|nr:MAG: hypothetical protein C5B42_05630 [Candidatus Cerribacteria bacterium 'Amazon FNV 2010 28 9']